MILSRVSEESDKMRNVDRAELFRFTHEVFLKAGVSTADAELVAASLVAANVCGVDSHGIQLLLPYVDQLAAGNIDPAVSGEILSELGCCILFDGKNGLGQTVAARCCDESIRLARRVGMSIVVAQNSNHFGRAAYWGARIAQQNCIGIVVSNASPLVAPWQGCQALLGTNPICVAAPGGWILDMATTSVAAGKIVDIIMGGGTVIPEGWALDTEGNAATSAYAAIKGTLMPLGGREAGFKGSGLAVAVEILTGVLSGGAIGSEVGSLRSRNRPASVSHSFIAVEVERLLPLAKFKMRVEQMLEMLKSSRRAPGYDEILVAGEREAVVERQRLHDGVPIRSRLWNTLQQLADRFQVAPLQAL